MRRHLIRAWLGPWGILALVLAALVVYALVIVHRTRPAIESVAWSAWWLTDCKANHACLASQVLAATGAARAASVQSYRASQSLNIAAGEVAAIAREAHQPIVQTARNLGVASGELAATIAEIHATAVDAHAGIAPLLQSSDAAVMQLGAALHGVESLTATITQSVKDGAPLVDDDLQKLGAAIDSVNALLSDGHIAATLANVDAGTASGAEALESVNIALRPLREKARLMKTLLAKAIGMLKFTIPILD